MSKPIVAILYDFDATLATSDMQNFSFIPSLGLTPLFFGLNKGGESTKQGWSLALIRVEDSTNAT